MGAAARYLKQLKDETSLPEWVTRRDRVIPQFFNEFGEDVSQIVGHESLKVAVKYSDSPLILESNTTNLSGCYEAGSPLSPPLPPSPLPLTKQAGLGKYWAIIAAGAGLFSDGYVNNSVGFMTTIFKRMYGEQEFARSSAMSNIASIAFAGTVVGQLVFGLVADYHSRRLGMVVSTLILIVFSVLLAGAWGAGMPEHPDGMFAAITVYRAILGIGIGGEYPAGSVACAEVSASLGHGKRNRWFVWFTNFMIDSGYVASAMVAWLLLYICSVPHDATGTHGLQSAWRLLVGLGAIPPMSLLYMRLKFEDNEQFRDNNFKRTRTPYWLAIKFYGPRLVVVSLIWFVYDFCSYSWGIYSSQIIQLVVKNGDLQTDFGWTVLFNVFYIPGAFLGALAADYFGPRLTLLSGTALQGIVGFILAGVYSSLMKNIGGFVVAYGIFTALGEFGPGDNIGLVASKTCSSAIRGQYYGIAAAVGKIGAFVGTKVFPAIANRFGGLDSHEGQTTLLYISSSLCLLSAVLALLLPSLTQNVVETEDERFKRYLAMHGFDVSLMRDLPDAART